MFNEKKFVLSFCLIFSLFFVLNIELYAASEGYIKGNNVRVRSKPTTTSRVVESLSNHKVKILSTTGNWRKVSFGKTTGWVRNDFITTSSVKNAQIKETSLSKTAKIVGGNVNVRSNPSKSAKVVKRLSDKSVKVIAKSGDWYKISVSGIKGWVRNDFIRFGNDSKTTLAETRSNETHSVKTANKYTGFITGSNVNIRSIPSKSGEVVTRLSGKNVRIVGSKSNWYKISYGSKTGWVKKEFVALSTSKINNSSNGLVAYSGLRNRIVLYSRNFLGVRYKWGGTSPKGFDCSGFTSYIYKKFGINIDRVSTAQATQGRYVPKKKLKPGDLVFFATSGGRHVNHAGVYIGNNKFIHASSSRIEHAVRISSLNEGFYERTYVTGRTFVK